MSHQAITEIFQFVDSFVDNIVDKSTGISTTTRKITVIFNSVAGNRKDALLHDVVAALRDRGLEVSIVGTTGPGNATQLAAEAVRTGADVIVAAGGDGTINEVVSGMIGSDTPVGIIPMGTANVLALELNLSRRATDIADVISAGTIRRLHVAGVNGRRFLLMVGAGFDGEVVHSITAEMKRRWGKYAFVLQGMRAILANPTQTLMIEIDGAQLSASWAVVTNISHYGGPYTLMPQADPGAPMLSTVLFRNAGRLAMCANLLRIGLGIASRTKSVTVIHSRSVCVCSPGYESVPVQIDGDAAGKLPVRIEATDQFVKVLSPVAVC